jgi:MoxR-like ATPase
MRLSVGYPDPRHELALLTEVDHAHSLDRVVPVTDHASVSAMISTAAEVHIADAVAAYVVDLAGRSREHSEVLLGVSPRAALGLLRAARVWAATEGRDYVTPDDVKRLAQPVLAHRIVLSRSAAARGADTNAFIAHLLDTTPVPA